MRWFFWIFRFFGAEDRRRDARRRHADAALADRERAKVMKGQAGFQLDRELRELGEPEVPRRRR